MTTQPTSSPQGADTPSAVGGFALLVEAVEPNRRVLYLPLDRASETVDQSADLHFGPWYQVEKGDIVEFSFALYCPNLFRDRPGLEPPLPCGGWWPDRRRIAPTP